MSQNVAPVNMSYSTPQNANAPRNYNFSALQPITVGQQTPAMPGLQPPGLPRNRTLSRGGNSSSAQYFQNLAA